MPSGDVSRFKGAQGGRPKRVLDICHNGKCEEPATKLAYTGDPRSGVSGMDTAPLCDKHCQEVTAKAAASGDQINSVPLSRQAHALHQRVQGIIPNPETPDARAPLNPERANGVDIAESFLLQHALQGNIPAGDVLVGKETAPRRAGRPSTTYRAELPRHLRELHERRTSEEGRAILEEHLSNLRDGVRAHPELQQHFEDTQAENASYMEHTRKQIAAPVTPDNPIPFDQRRLTDKDPKTGQRLPAKAYDMGYRLIKDENGIDQVEKIKTGAGQNQKSRRGRSGNPLVISKAPDELEKDEDY